MPADVRTCPNTSWIMDVMNPRTFQLQPIDPSMAADLRALGGVTYVADTKPGYPCRQCLCDAEIGEELILVSHDPFTSQSPYRSASPIFLHRHDCAPPTDTHELPTQLTGRQLSVRSFDDNEMMIDAAVIDGRQLSDTIGRFFSDDGSQRIHVHNATRGCWAVSVERS